MPWDSDVFDSSALSLMRNGVPKSNNVSFETNMRHNVSLYDGGRTDKRSVCGLLHTIYLGLSRLSTLNALRDLFGAPC